MARPDLTKKTTMVECMVALETVTRRSSDILGRQSMPFTHVIIIVTLLVVALEVWYQAGRGTRHRR
jgi:hypothetical protein